MDSSDTKRKRPSLLASQEAPETRTAQQQRMLSEIEPRRPERAYSRRRLAWLAAGLGVLLIALVWLISGSDTPTPATSRHAATTDVAHGTQSPSTHPTPNAQAAVIVDDDNAPLAADGTAAASQTDPAASASSDSAGLLAAMHLSDPASAKPHAPAKHHRRRTHRHARTDTDIDLLAALMAHVGTQKPNKTVADTHATSPSASPFAGLEPASRHSLKAQLHACPAANTSAGIRCRQKICASHRGTDPACPKPATSEN